jgi:hypothetical protein
MKFRAIAIAILLTGFMAACTQKTCPTYTKDQPQPAQKEVNV